MISYWFPILLMRVWLSHLCTIDQLKFIKIPLWQRTRWFCQGSICVWKQSIFLVELGGGVCTFSCLSESLSFDLGSGKQPWWGCGPILRATHGGNQVTVTCEVLGTWLVNKKGIVSLPCLREVILWKVTWRSWGALWAARQVLLSLIRTCGLVEWFKW
jgi:hypothetical protein